MLLGLDIGAFAYTENTLGAIMIGRVNYMV